MWNPYPEKQGANRIDTKFEIDIWTNRIYRYILVQELIDFLGALYSKL